LFFWATIVETAEEWCGGRVPAAEDTTVDFIVTELPGGYQQTFTVDIVEVQGYTFGAIEIIEVPLGAYQVTEVVPKGYDAAAFPWDETQTVDGVTVTIEVGAEAEETLFVNVPITATTPTIMPTMTPTSTATTPTATSLPPTPGMTPTAPATSVPPTQEPTQPVVTPPIVPPEVTPPSVPITGDTTVTVLPSTGQSTPGESTVPLIALGLAAASLALGAVALRRYRRIG
jgi:hypothetical protein